MTITRSRHRFTVDEYQEMIERNILTEQDNVELIRGEIVEKMNIGKRHAATVKRLNLFFTLLSSGRYVVSVQDPVGLGDSVPEPDVALLAFRDDLYEFEAPTPAESGRGTFAVPTRPTNWPRAWQPGPASTTGWPFSPEPGLGSLPI